MTPEKLMARAIEIGRAGLQTKDARPFAAVVVKQGEIVGAFGRNGRNAGEFHWVHNLAVDSKGNIYTTEVDTGKRAQKFRYVGPAVR